MTILALMQDGVDARDVITLCQCVTCRKDFGDYRNQLMLSILPYLNSGRQVVTDTCHLVIIFVGVLVLVDILGTVLWMYLKRCV